MATGRTAELTTQRETEPAAGIAAGPRLTAKGRATRGRIVDTAAQLMFERGVGGTSIEDVLLAAGVSASQLYHYFDDKQALVRAVIAHQTDRMLALQAPALDALDSF